MESTGKYLSQKSKLSPLSVWALAFGCITGASSFIMPSDTFLPYAGPVGSLLAIILGAVVFMVGSRSYSYMIQKLPTNGGTFVYTNSVFGRSHGLLAAWAIGFAYLALLWVNCNNIILILRWLYGDILQVGFHYQLAGDDIYAGEAFFAAFVLVGVAFVVAFGKRVAVYLQNILGIALLASVLALFVGTFSLSDFSGIFAHPFVRSDRVESTQILHIFLLAPFLYVGCETTAHAAGEFGFSARLARVIMPVAIACSMFVYCALDLMVASAVPPAFSSNAEYIAYHKQLMTIESVPILYVVYSRMGMAGVAILDLALISAFATSLVGWLRVLPNLIKSVADARMLPKKFRAVTHEHVPQKATLLVLALSLPTVFVGQTVVGWLVDATSICTMIAFTYVAYCCIYSARKDGNKKYVKLGYAGLIIAMFLMIVPLLASVFVGNMFSIASYFILVAWASVGYVATVLIRD